MDTILSVSNFIGFLEFLLAWNISPKVVSNYASGIQSYTSLYQLPTMWMDNSLISNYLRAMHIQVPHVKKQKLTLSLQDMHNVSMLLEQFDHPLVYRATFLLSFYGSSASQT